MFASKLTNSVGIDQFREAAQHFLEQALFESLSEPAMNTNSVKNFSCIPTTLLICFVLLSGCRSHKTIGAPSIKLTRVPQAVQGNFDKLDIIQGNVTGAHPGQQIVLYVKTGNWSIQPLSNLPFTNIRRDSSWINSTHLGSEYAALLVDSGYHPPAEMNSLPALGNGVVAIAMSKDYPSATVVSPTLQFSGYEWRVRNAPSNRGDRVNQYSPANAWTDTQGALHLRIAREGDKWTCAEVTLTRSFGYGTYSFVVRDTSTLGPGVQLSMFTWDYASGDQNNREIAIEVAPASDPDSKNAQYVIQPFYIAANVSKFSSPSGLVTHSFRWEPGSSSFRTVSGSLDDPRAKILSEHVFNSGVPSPGVESVRMALYLFGSTENPSQTGTEVVIEKFQFVP